MKVGITAGSKYQLHFDPGKAEEIPISCDYGRVVLQGEGSEMGIVHSQLLIA